MYDFALFVIPVVVELVVDERIWRKYKVTTPQKRN